MFEARTSIFGWIAEKIERDNNRFEVVADGKKPWAGVIEKAGEKILGTARLEEDSDVLTQLQKVVPAVIGTIVIETTSPKGAFFLMPDGEVLTKTGMQREGLDGIIKYGKLHANKVLAIDEYLRGAQWSQSNPTAQESSYTD